jgi:hypothetical protein
MAKDPKALASFNKSIRGLVFKACINAYGGRDGGDPIITCYAVK